MSALRRDFLPQHLKAELESNGFRGSVAVQARQTLQETRWLLQLAQDSPWILGVVGWIDLRSPDVRSQLKTLVRNPKLVGIRHVVQSEPDDRFLLQPEFLRGISVLEEFDLAYDLLIYSKHLPVTAEFVGRFPASALCWIIWPSRRSKAARSIPGRRESHDWPSFQMWRAKCRD